MTCRTFSVISVDMANVVDCVKTQTLECIFYQANYSFGNRLLSINIAEVTSAFTAKKYRKKN